MTEDFFDKYRNFTNSAQFNDNMQALKKPSGAAVNETTASSSLSQSHTIVTVKKKDFKTTRTNNIIRVYAPQIFRYIRFMDGIQENDIIKSLDPKCNRLQIFKTNKGTKHNEGGKSGSFFFFSQDKKFIIKTLKKSERQLLLDMLPSLVKFIHENDNKSIISRIYGIYRVKLPGVAPVDIILQRNAMQCQPGNVLVQTFDLKGSWFKRNVLRHNMFEEEENEDAEIRATS